MILLFFVNFFYLFLSQDFLLITLDTTRADYINDKNSPFIYKFLRESYNFVNCRTPVPLTLPAHTSILTGLYPKNHKVRNNSSYRLKDDILTIQEILKKEGYFNAAFLSSFVLNKSYNLNKGFDIYDDEMVQSYEKNDFEMEERSARDTAKRALNFLENFKGEKLFLWVHFFDPHYPYINHQEAPKDFSNYSKEIFFMDIYVEEVVEKFLEKRKGIVVIAGDHGESLGEHGEETHGVFLYESVLKVPLVIKFPDKKEGKIFKEPVLIIDIFPTILDYLKIPFPEKIDGKSLFENLPERYFYFESYLPSESFGWSTPFGAFDGKFKFIYLPKKELYNLEEDPKELKNIFDGEKEKVRELFGKLKKEYTIEYEKNLSQNISLEELKKMESLGYLSGSKPNKERDPKDLIWIVKALDEGKNYASQKNYQKAEETFLKIIKANPENYPALIQYGTLLREQGKIDEAFSIFKKAKDLNPYYIHSRFNLGTLYFEKGDLSQAEKEFLKIIEILPSFSEPHFYLVMIYLKRGEIKKAKDIMEKAKGVLKKEANLYFYQGLIYVSENKYTDAIESFKNALNYEPGYFDAKFNLAQAYYKNGKVQDALREYEESLKINPSFPETYLIIGSIYLYDLNDNLKAKKYFSLFLERFPQHPEAKNVKEILNSF